MLGTMWVNTGFGALASVITFFTALAGNVWLVSLERAGYAFILFFLAAFPIRWLVAKIMGSFQAPETMVPAEAAEGGVPSASGEPDDPQGDGEFIPLSLDQMGSAPLAHDPTTVADVVRRLTDE
ncbi:MULTISPECIES: hypothetical protein [Brevibacillus]|jgi:hypothetical protein|uniref:Uncharacterized protein n=1 Tax=Brevibacillus borstelensis AK1 TaxID=1300222 RepID=M8E4G9_9BACL|nr:hypothetical protein [Brevibacillus borstelensis]EMT54166.1 hypothetical protein I532_01130 [Brevibacillus borstelensis AK1]KKX53991.1 hypothetical protein X546_16665 [Brevibacillus borstelensis cifa_chp40]MBE5398015.1 hypothetical protein [Brevibacillus borstelensis]MCC0563470.1 hypothetical protein [Brevibacillus borstelensis]MCM3470039.1 hypothetical protein [Brevibacillus borstelensis]